MYAKQYFLNFLFSIMFFIVSNSFAFTQSTGATNLDENDILNKPLLSELEIEWIKAHPVLKSSNKLSAAPIEFVRAGEPAGFSVDYLNLVAEKVGLKIEYVYGPQWADLLKMLENREIDISHNIVQNPEREAYLDFTSSYIELIPAFFGSDDSESIKTLDDMKNKSVLLLKGWGDTEKYKKIYPETVFYEIANITEALIAISNGEYDLTILPHYTSSYLIESNFITNVRSLGVIDFMDAQTMNYAKLASRNDWPILRDILQKGMLLVSDEEYKNLINKWLLSVRDRNDLNLTQEELNWLSENPKVKIAVDPTIIPVEFIDENGEISGISGSYLKIIEEKLDIKFEWIGNSDFQDGIDKILLGEADVISAVTPSDERTDYLDHTSTYMSLDSVIFARERGDLIVDIDGLKGKKIAQVKTFQLTRRIKNTYPSIEVVEVDTIQDALKLLSAGVVDAYIGSVPITSYTIAMNNLSNIVAVGTTPYSSSIAIGIRSELPYLSSAVQKAMNSITAEDKAQINRRWIMLDKPPEPDFTLIWEIILGAFVIILLVLAWNYRLRKEMARRRASEERFRQIAETVDGIFFIGSEKLDHIRYISPLFEKWTNYSCEDLYQNSLLWFNQIHPDDRILYEQSIKRMIKSNFTMKFPDYRMLNPDGSERWLSTQMHPVYEDGKVVSIIGFINDISTRIKSRAKLEEINSQFQNAFTFASHGMALVGLDGKFMRVNDALCEILGYSDDELLKLSSDNVTHVDDQKISRTLMNELLEGRRVSFELEISHITKNGDVVPTQLNVSLVTDSENNPVHYVAQIQNLAKLKEREEQLRHSQKMDAVGKLTGGIAHDFNNILGIILGNLEILKSTIDDGEKQKVRLDKAINGVDRGSHLIKKLLSFSQKVPNTTDVVSINKSIKSIYDFVAKSLSISIKVELLLKNDLWPVEIDSRDFEDVILNLALNARDAMPEGGTLTIKTDNVILDEEYVRQYPEFETGDYVIVTVMDTGVGIATELMDKVLEPFFTTKADNKGTGLGLSMVHGFIQRSGGYLRLNSKVGKGTSILLYIPKSDNDVSDDAQQEMIDIELPKGKEKILIVDDEKYLCEIAERQLSTLGYSIYTASNAKAALQVLNDNKDIDLLFSDIVMPDNQDGYKIASSAMEIQPSIKVLLTSGFSQNLEENIKEGDDKLTALSKNILNKPYNHQELAVAVRRSLDV